MDVTKPYKFIGLGARYRPEPALGHRTPEPDVRRVTRPCRHTPITWPPLPPGGPKPHKFIGFGVMEVTKPYKFIGFGAMELHTFKWSWLAKR